MDERPTTNNKGRRRNDEGQRRHRTKQTENEEDEGRRKRRTNETKVVEGEEK